VVLHIIHIIYERPEIHLPTTPNSPRVSEPLSRPIPVRVFEAGCLGLGAFIVSEKPRQNFRSDDGATLCVRERGTPQGTVAESCRSVAWRRLHIPFLKSALHMRLDPALVVKPATHASEWIDACCHHAFSVHATPTSEHGLLPVRVCLRRPCRDTASFSCSGDWWLEGSWQDDSSSMTFIPTRSYIGRRV
jgi:hypothetical protein